MCVAPLNSIFLSFSISHSMRNRWGNKRGMFYLGKILVYPDNSYFLFIRPDYQQVPGGGGSEGYHIVSFSPSCLLLSVCSYSCGIHFRSILCIPRRNLQRSSPHRRTRRNTSPGRAGREGFFTVFRSVFTYLCIKFILCYDTHLWFSVGECK